MLLPASSIGLLSAGVLNLNNMRDIESDKLSNKHTLAGYFGSKNAKNLSYSDYYACFRTNWDLYVFNGKQFNVLCIYSFRTVTISP